MNAPLKSILVVGPAPDAPLAALTLKRRYPRLEVSQLILPGTPDPAGESTTPLFFQHLTGTLGLAGADVHRYARPNWTLGFRMRCGMRGSFIRAFDSKLSETPPGFAHNAGFHSLADGPDLASLGGALISCGHVFPKDRQRSVKLLESITGLQLRPAPLTDLLLRGCKVVGVVTHEGSIQSVETSDAGVRALVLADGTRLSADFHVDLTGPDAPLLAALGRSRFEPEASGVFPSRAWTVTRRRGSEPLRPCSTIESVDAGWRWRIEHDDTLGFGLGFDPESLSEEEALESLRAKVGETVGDPVAYSWQHGRQSAPWSGNVVAMGDADGFLPPLAGMRLSGIVYQLHWLCRVLGETDGKPGDQARALYNRTQHAAWHEMRDFLALHHRFNTGSDSPYWQRARADADLGAHGHFVHFYQTGGPSGLLEQALANYPSTIGLDTWLAALVGLGLPCAHPPDLPASELQAWKALSDGLLQQAKAGADPATCLQAIRKQAAPQRREHDPIF